MQQPVGQVVASQVQVPLVVSQSPFEHAAQVAPAVPHELPDCEPHGSHVPPVPPLQQPFGHDAASQMHVPLLVLHSRPVPHAEQLPPAVPHWALVSDAHGTHWPDELQQPCGHDDASHTQLPVALHSVPLPQALHAAPPVPHEVLLSLAYVSQVPLLQQPLHIEPPQVHCPVTQADPLAHAAHAAPPVPHSDVDWEPWSMHLPVESQQPLGHEAALHTH